MIDVLIPAYNAEKTIRSSVESILGQSITAVRVLVVNDGSTDATADILAEMAKDDPRLEIITTQNRGIVDALNTGLAHCRTEIIARHDADDIAYPHRLARQLEYLANHPDCVAVGCNAWHIDAAGRKLGRTNFSGDAIGVPRWIPAGEPYLMHPFLAAKSAAIKNVGGYRHVIHAEDTDLYFRLAPLGRLHNLDDILGEYRIHSGVTSASVVNVRIGALNSQLAAVSAIRCAEGRRDFDFAAESKRAYEEVGSLQAMVDLAAEQLDLAETAHVTIALAVKFIQLRTIRKFRFTNNDRAFVARAIRRYYSLLNRPQRRQLARQLMHIVRPKFGLRRIAIAVRARMKGETAG